MWFWMAIAALLCWSGSDLFSKVGSKPDDKFSHWKMVMAVGLVMGLHAGYEVFVNGVEITWEVIWRYMPASALYILSMILGYVGLRYIELSVSSPICNSSGAIAAIFCMVILGQTVENLQAVAVAMVCVGVVVLGIVEYTEDDAARLERQKASNIKYAKSFIAILLPVLYCLIDAAGTVADEIILESADSGYYYMIEAADTLEESEVSRYCLIEESDDSMEDALRLAAGGQMNVQYYRLTDGEDVSYWALITPADNLEDEFGNYCLAEDVDEETLSALRAYAGSVLSFEAADGEGIAVIKEDPEEISFFSRLENGEALTEDELAEVSYYYWVDEGAAYAILSKGLNEDSANVAYELTFLFMGVCAFIYTVVIKREKITIPREGPKLLAGIFETAGQFAYVHALAAGDAAVAAPIISSYCVVSVLWSRLFLKEKLSWKHYAAIILTVAGIVILGIYDG